MHKSGGGRLRLNVEERAIASQNRQRIVEDLKVLLLRHPSQIANHEVRCEVRVATGPVALLRAGDIQSCLYQKIMFEIEAGAIGILWREHRAQNQRCDTGVQVLADFERHFDLFFEWRRDWSSHKGVRGVSR